ncbi:hypothetical protein OA949_02325, partial [Candidatus Pelagibacter sp.]|nr:hypothetical protein [Candidatus Pelagibacter sp.]
MSRHSHLSEFFKKISIIINNLIIKNSKKLNLKEKKNLILQLISLKRVFIASIILLILFLSFLSLPIVYDKFKTQNMIKSQLLSKYNIKFIFLTDMKYGLFPWPNYRFENVKILNDDNKKLADIKNLKINLEISNFF